MTHHDDPFDELAGMFMTAGPATETPSRSAVAEAPPRARTELLVVGHLPVRAALWLAPYADAAAREVGPVGLVRLDGDEPMMQLFAEVGAAPPELPADSGRSLREAMLALRGQVRKWIVRPSSRTSVTELLGFAADRVVVLTGADQVAVVNTYELVKALHETARAEGLPRPELAVAVIGSSAEDGRAVADRIGRVTEERLGIELAFDRALPRMDASPRGTPLRAFPGPQPPSLADVRAWATGGGRPSERREKPAATPEPGTDGFATAPPTATSTPQRPDATIAPAAPSAVPPIAEPAAAPTAPVAPTAATPASPFPEPIEGTTPRRVIRMAPRAEAEIEPKAPVADSEPNEAGRPIALSAHVAGLRSLRPRCPGRERVELALDGEGRLHLLARVDELRAVRFVETWARAHRELIEMASPGERFGPPRDATVHLFTDAPRAVRDLVGAGLHLHLLAPVDAGGTRAWYHAELDRPEDATR